MIFNRKPQSRAANLISQLTCSDTFLSLAVVGLLVLMVVPMTAGLLDFMLALSIAASLGILLMATFNRQSSDFSVFPTMLLLVTLYRLALNVASTRLILTNGKTGHKAAGELIATFGEIVIHGNTFVGILVFIILNVINFIVITKGAGRISEVAARFMLDSLPGKQMSIDSDLKSGALRPEEAQAKRAELDQQGDFYGAMDGASKFVKGDAIAGLVITAINILGGLFVGIAQDGMPFAQAIKTYTLLTVGDGLVSQFPALIVSTAAGIVVTKAGSSKRALGSDFAQQLTANPRVFLLLSAILFVLGVFLRGAGSAFWALSFVCAIVGTLAKRKQAGIASAVANEDANKKMLADMSMANFGVTVGLGLANQLTRDQNLQEDLEKFVKDLSQKTKTQLPFIRIEDSSEMGLFEYLFSTPQGNIFFEQKLREKEFYLVGSDEMSQFDERLSPDELLQRPCAWISAEERVELSARGILVVTPAELFRWHLFMAYRKMFKTDGTKGMLPETEMSYGIENL